jgi:hypothetical protein
MKAEIFRVDTWRENLLTCFGNSLTLPHQKETLHGPTTLAIATETQADPTVVEHINKIASHKIIQHEGISEKQCSDRQYIYSPHSAPSPFM